MSTESDVSLLVNTFNTKVRGDALLFTVFDPILKDNWDEHLQKHGRLLVYLVIIH